MNPFVGLSRVTKKRIDALENYSKEIEALKNKMMQMESDFEQFQKTKPVNEAKTTEKRAVKQYQKNDKEKSVPPALESNSELTDEELEQVVDNAITMFDDPDHIEKQITTFLDQLD